MAVGNTFGATALSSYGGFWISFAIILTPGGFNIEAGIIAAQDAKALTDSIGFFLMVSDRITVSLMYVKLMPRTGLVHLHLPPPHLHPQINCGLLPPLLHS
jgi:succinate-acetate transporter protein